MFEIRARRGVIEGSQNGLYFIWEGANGRGGTYIDVYNGGLNAHAKYPFDVINTSRRAPGDHGDGRILFSRGNFRRKVNEWIYEFNRREFRRDFQ